MKNTKIEWCDHTFNPWEGCTKVSPGCTNCYAESRNARFGGGTAPNWGKGAPRRRTSPANWKLPEKWNQKVSEEIEEALHCFGEDRYIAPPRPRVFCASLADWLDPEVPTEWLADLLDLIRRTPNLDWLLLTKRPELWRERMSAAQSHLFDFGCRNACGWLWDWIKHKIAPANIWIGTTVENQAVADKRICSILEIPTEVRFLSCEPLLGELDLMHYLDPIDGGYIGKSFIDWVICGGESGSNARPMHPDWARSLREQCAEAGVPFLFKQWGEWAPGEYADRAQTKTERVASLIDGEWSFDAITPSYAQGMHADDEPDVWRLGKRQAGRHLDGREHNDFPS